MVMPVGKEGDILLLLFAVLFGIPVLVFALIHILLGLPELLGIFISIIIFFILAFYILKYYLRRRDHT